MKGPTDEKLIQEVADWLLAEREKELSGKANGEKKPLAVVTRKGRVGLNVLNLRRKLSGK